MDFKSRNIWNFFLERLTRTLRHMAYLNIWGELITFPLKIASFLAFQVAHHRANMEDLTSIVLLLGGIGCSKFSFHQSLCSPIGLEWAKRSKANGWAKLKSSSKLLWKRACWMISFFLLHIGQSLVILTNFSLGKASTKLT